MNKHSKSIYLTVILSVLLFMSNAMATGQYGELKNNYPADPSQCEAGKVYDDGEFGLFTYLCRAPGQLCAQYCLTFSDDERIWVSMQRDEQITYNQDSALRCEVDKEGYLNQYMEDISTELVSTSKVPFCK